MRRSEPMTSWVNYALWSCNKHLPAARIPADIEKCWYGCGDVRPSMEARPKAKQVEAPTKLVVPNSMFCAWHECNTPTREGSKYCSRNCSNKNARARHKARKAA